MKLSLETREAEGGTVRELSPGLWRLEIPTGPVGKYRWAQLDDHLGRSRRSFPWRPPLRMELRARVSSAELAGTWGFGLWNDPFSASFGVSGAARKLPALPNAAWFFYAGPPNHLAFRDDHPAQGFLAATFSAAPIPSLLLAPGALTLPLLALPPTARLVRRAARLLLNESGALVPGDPTQWHAYRIEWGDHYARFLVDDAEVLLTPVSPRAPLGFILWVDNQYAAFPPSGKLGMGTLPTPEPFWLEVDAIKIDR